MSFASTRVHSRLFGGVRVVHFVFVVCVCVVSSVLWCRLRFPHETVLGSSLPIVVCGWCFICVCLCIFGVWHMLCCVFSVSVTCCIVYFRCPTHAVLCICFAFLRLLCRMLQVSLDCPFCIAPSVFSCVYLHFINNIYFLKIRLEKSCTDQL